MAELLSSALRATPERRSAASAGAAGSRSKPGRRAVGRERRAAEDLAEVARELRRVRRQQVAVHEHLDEVGAAHLGDVREDGRRRASADVTNASASS